MRVLITGETIRFCDYFSIHQLKWPNVQERELTLFSISLVFSCWASFSIFSISSNLWTSDPQALQHAEERSVWGQTTMKSIKHAWKTHSDSGSRERFLSLSSLTPLLREIEGRLQCSHGNRVSLSPFWGAGRVASGDAGLHAVWAFQAQGVVCLASTRWRLVMQDGVMDCGRQVCAVEVAVKGLQCPLPTEHPYYSSLTVAGFTQRPRS